MTKSLISRVVPPLLLTQLLLLAVTVYCQEPVAEKKEERESRERAKEECEANPLAARCKQAIKDIKAFGGDVTPYADPDSNEVSWLTEHKVWPRYYTVTFTNSELTDSDLISLREQLSCIDPKKLDVSFTKVRGRFCQHMELRRLAELDLSSTLIDDCGLQQITNPGSQIWRDEDSPFRLRLNRIKVSHEALKQFVHSLKVCGPKNLILAIAGITVIDDTRRRVPGEPVPKITGIELLNDLVAIKKILTGLDVSSTYVPDDGNARECDNQTAFLNKLTEFDRLTRLGIADNNLKTKAFDDCDPFPRPFEALSLAGNKQIGDDAMTLLTLPPKSPKLPKLVLTKIKSLILTDTQLTNKGLNILLGEMSDATLVRLEISNTYTIFPRRMSTATGWFADIAVLFAPPLRTLPKLKELRVLDVSGTGVSNSELTDINEMKELSYVNLKNTVVTSKGVENLSGLGLRSQYFNVVLTNTHAAIQGAPTPPANARLDGLRYNGDTTSRTPLFQLRPSQPDFHRGGP
jgi:hypothetical protein